MGEKKNSSLSINRSMVKACYGILTQMGVDPHVLTRKNSLRHIKL